MKNIISKIKRKVYCMYIFLKLSTLHIFNKRLFIFISSPYYGNIGDHAIFLSQLHLLERAGIKKGIVDISSKEYGVAQRVIKRCVKPNDVLFIDGGGNLGDTWPETMKHINSIVESYCSNKIFIFPESWYFSNNPGSIELLEKTKYVFSKHPYLTVYARDSWSYHKMKDYLNNNEVKLAVDCVLLNEITFKDESKHNVYGLAIRNDCEKISGVDVEKLKIILENNGIGTRYMENDCKCHIKKTERNKCFTGLISEYLSSDVIITDRFHGMIFSILTNKPCIVLNNSTGKVKHFFEDISQHISGIHLLEDNASEEDVCKYCNSIDPMIKHKSYNVLINGYKAKILEDLNKLLEG